METDVSESVNGFHKPVPPCASGEGLPYAPANWPNLGDVWTWKVGNNISPAGNYIHRSLIVPKRLQKTPTRKIWLGSKEAVVRFLQSEFPEADIDAFFASFTWDIPADIGAAPKVKKGSSAKKSTAVKKSTPVKKEKSTPKEKTMPMKKSIRTKKSALPKTSMPKNAPESGTQTRKRTRNSGSSNLDSMPKNEAEESIPKNEAEKSMPKKEAETGRHIAKRTRSAANANQGSTENANQGSTENANQGSTPKIEVEPASPIVRTTRNSTRRRSTGQDKAISMDLPLTEGVPLENSRAHDVDVTLYPVKDTPGRSGSRRKRKNSNSQMNQIADMSSEDFENYLNSLDDIIYESVPKAPPTLDSSLLETDYDFARAREELSILLSQDLSSLITSDKLPLFTSLSSRLRSDPDLTLEELSMLDLILEIPAVSNDLLNAKQVKAEASKFFADLETNIALVSRLRSKYTLSKDKIAVLQAENASHLPTIEEIDDQIAKLQSRRDALATAVEKNEEQIDELSRTQNRILNSLPKIVNEVQTSNAEKSAWEMKHKEAAKEEGQILEKFAQLDGFTFIH